MIPAKVIKYYEVKNIKFRNAWCIVADIGKETNVAPNILGAHNHIGFLEVDNWLYPVYHITTGTDITVVKIPYSRSGSG